MFELGYSDYFGAANPQSDDDAYMDGWERAEEELEMYLEGRLDGSEGRSKFSENKFYLRGYEDAF